MEKPTGQAATHPALSPYLLRFARIFTLFALGSVFLILSFRWTGNAGLAIGSVMAAAVAAAQKFLPEQKRAFTLGEALRMSLWSFMVVVLVVLCGIAVLEGIVGLWPELADGFLSVVVSDVSWLLLLGSQQLVKLAAGVSLGLFVALFISYSFLAQVIYRGMVKRGEL